MKLVNWIDQIEYLVNKRFPGSKAPQPIMLSNRGGSGYNHAQHEKFLANIKSYKDELFKKTQAEVKALYDAEYDKEVGLIQLKLKLEEQSRFFNLQSANADFIHWSKMPHWSLDEAIALSFGKSPNIVSWSDVNKYTEVSPFAKEYEKRRDLALRALPWKKLFDPVSPSIFFNWAREIDIELPVELISEVEKRTGITRYWFNEYKIIKAAYDELQNNNVLVSAVVETPLFDKVSSTYPPELDFAVKAWQAVSIIEGRGKPKTRIRAWLVANANDLSDEAKKRICVVANWDKRGGATRTGSK